MLPKEIVVVSGVHISLFNLSLGKEFCCIYTILLYIFRPRVEIVSGRIPKMVLRGKDTAGKASGVKESIATVDIVIFTLQVYLIYLNFQNLFLQISEPVHSH